MNKLFLCFILTPVLCQAQHSSSPGSELTKSSATATYIPYVGANKNINVNSRNIIGTGDIQFDTATLTGNAFSVGISTLVVKQGNVGIGVAAPLKILDIQSRNADAEIVVRSSNTSGELGGTSKLTLGFNNHAGAGIAAYKTGALNTAGLKLYTEYGFSTPEERMVITPIGDIGIGTAIPSTKLEVVGDVTASAIKTQYIYNPPDGIYLSTAANTTASGIFISSAGAIQHNGIGSGTFLPNSRGYGAIDLNTYRSAATQVASGNYSVIGGGQGNTASAIHTTVAGGGSCVANAARATVGGGLANYSQGTSATISGGEGNTANGARAVIPGGYNNIATGNYSFAAGYGAISNGAGSFTWADQAGVSVTNGTPDRTWFKNRGGFLVTGSTQTISDGGFFVSGRGNVGIGNTNPSSTLDTTGNISLSGIIKSSGTGSVPNYFAGGVSLGTSTLSAHSSPLYVYGFSGDSYGGSIDIYSSYLGTDQHGIMIDGDAGASTTATHVALYGKGTSIGAFGSRDGKVDITYNTGLTISSGLPGGTYYTHVAVSTNGYIGIGNTNPTDRLNVAGDVNITGAYKINGTPVSGLGDAVLSATQTFTGENTFSSVESTTTFSGLVDIGWERITCSSGGGSNECTSTCSANKIVISCGCQAAGANAIYANYPIGNNACRCYNDAPNASGYAICARVKPY